MLQGMERWHSPGVTGNDTGRSSRLFTASIGSSGSSTDERISLGPVIGRSRSNSLPIRVQSQSEYLDSIRALAQAYSTTEQHWNSSGIGHAAGAAAELVDGYVTRPRSATMIDTHRHHGRMDSEQTSNSGRTFGHSLPMASDTGEVFALPASEEEKAKIINSRLQELDSTQRSWKKRVADYVHGLPSTKPLPGEGGRMQDPKRRRLWSTGCERLPWEIRSSDGVAPRQRITTVSSDSTFSCSQLSTSSSRDSIQHWVDSIDGQEDLDATLIPGQTNGERRRSTGNLPFASASRKISDQGNGTPKRGTRSVDDDLGLGADAESVTGSSKGEDAKTNQVTGPGGKKLEKKLTNTDIINMANQTRALQSRRKQLQRMGSSAMSDTSMASVSDLLFARNDPEELLLNLGFGGGKEPNPLERIPNRFLQQPSTVRGISIDNYLMLSETQDQKYGFSLHGGLRGLGAVLQQSVCAISPSSEYLMCPADVGEATSWTRGFQSTSSISQDGQQTVNSDRQSSTSDKLSIQGGETPRTDSQVLNSQPGTNVGDANLTRLRNGLSTSPDFNSKAKDASLTSQSFSNGTTSLPANPACRNELSSSTLPNQVGSNSAVADSSSGCELISDSSDSDWDYEEVDPSSGGLRLSEDHRRSSRLSRMVMPEPLLPPVSEELEVSQTAQSLKPPTIAACEGDPEQNLQRDSQERLNGIEHRKPTEGCSPKRGVELSIGEKRITSLNPERSTHRLTPNQESFEIEEISSTENQEDSSSANRTADKVPGKEPLVRTDSAQSDSSGFADEVMDSTIASNSPCLEDRNGSPQRVSGEGNNSRPEMGNKLIQTSFDDFGVLESFERDEAAQDASDTVFEEEGNSVSERSSTVSNAERIARSRKSFRESRSSYDRMGSTFSGISISSLEDSPFDGDGPALPVRTLHVPRQRSGTYPTEAEKQEVSPGPKTVVEILTTLQENIKQATEAKKLIKDEEAGNSTKRRPALSKMKSVNFDCFPLEDIPSIMESVEAILGRSKEVSPSVPESDTDRTNVVHTFFEDIKTPSAVVENGVVEESSTCKSNLKVLKRKSSQISMVPTLPCLDEEKTPAHSRHSSVTDTQHSVPKQNSAGHCTDTKNVSETNDIHNCVECPSDTRSDELICADLVSDTDTPVSMVANADSIGDVGDLEEEMRYLEHVESLLQEQGRLLEEASPPRCHPKPQAQEKITPPREEAIVPESRTTSKSCPTTLVAPEAIDQFVSTVEISSSIADQPFHKHSGPCLSLSTEDDEAHLANTTVISNSSSDIDTCRTSPPTELVESSVCLYLSPTPFVIDVSVVPCSSAENEDGVPDSEELCNCPEAELAPQRYRTSFELALENQSPKEKCKKVTQYSTESAGRIKPEDDLHDMKLIQRALFKYKQDLCELESLAERLYARHLDEDGEGEEFGGGAMTERERAELESVRDLRRQVLEEVEVMEGQLAQRMRTAVTRSNFPDGLEKSLATASEDNLEVIQEMVNLLEEQRSLRRMLQDLETTHSHTSLSEASTVPDLSAVGSLGSSYQEEEEEEEEDVVISTSEKREMMQALMDVRLELQHQRETARREMNNAVKEAKDKEIEQLKGLLREQRRLQDGE
ncbi:uncharacterized protein LOC119740419 isoform X2 [Patiria miniata]|uniref:ITPR-interacting domain-containing protein n=1 Tax=Patiria miniata TaxID=46514 RepID=A0A914B698_PATMI|nr:uncharacterized protein LOC119740419 isoform X2 [Patiria miniata]